MLHRTKPTNLLVFFCSFIALNAGALPGGDSVLLYTPYTNISVAPGKTINYSIDLINNGRGVVDAGLILSGLPSSWKYTIKSGEYTIKQLSVLPGDRKTVNLSVDVPLKVNKGNYPFRVTAGNVAALSLTINVSEQGTFKTEFTATQPNMQGKAGSTFTFNTTLRNLTADKQAYALMANAPRGWNVTFKYNYQQVTSAEINANSTGDITIEVIAPEMAQAGTYQIPVRATTSGTSVELGIEVVITGSYGMQLTTPTGLLSTDITANDQKRIELLLQNTGSAELQNVQLTASSPINWEVTFDPKKIDRIPAGQAVQAFAVIKAAKKAITGDYVTNLEAKTQEVSSKATFRVSVKTPMIWGWTGILVILIALGSIWYLFRTYGRR